MRAARVTTLVLAVLLAATGVWAQKGSAQAKKRELGDIQRELESTRREIDGYQKLEQSLDKELQKIQSRTGEERRRMENIQRNMRAAEQKKLELTSRLTALGRLPAARARSARSGPRRRCRGRRRPRCARA